MIIINKFSWSHHCFLAIATLYYSKTLGTPYIQISTKLIVFRPKLSKLVRTGNHSGLNHEAHHFLEFFLFLEIVVYFHLTQCSHTVPSVANSAGNWEKPALYSRWQFHKTLWMQHQGISRLEWSFHCYLSHDSTLPLPSEWWDWSRKHFQELTQTSSYTLA